jgi:hypothetical protein
MVASIRRKQVLYVHHTRDADGDVVFYFVDARDAGRALRQSSPVVSLRRLLSAVFDPQGRGNLAKYLIVTQNSEYEVQMPRDKAQHLAQELRMPPSDSRASIS